MIQAGEYPIVDGCFDIGAARFKVRERVGTPKQFFIRTNPFLYCSSLYPTSRADIFGFEVGRVWYSMQFTGTTVKIAKPRFLAPPEPVQDGGARTARREAVTHNLPSLSPSRR